MIAAKLEPAAFAVLTATAIGRDGIEIALPAFDRDRVALDRHPAIIDDTGGIFQLRGRRIKGRDIHGVFDAVQFLSGLGITIEISHTTTFIVLRGRLRYSCHWCCPFMVSWVGRR